jgi:putative phosphoesterase
MRVLLLADIHANWPALQAIQEPFDVCLVLGDLVDYGLEPAPCIDWVRQRGTFVIRGNHDHGVAQQVRVNGKNGYKYLTGVTRILTQEKITTTDRRYLGSLPISKRLTLDNTKFLMVHATPRDPLDEFAIADVDFWSRRLHDVDAQVVCVGHTHHPYVLEVGDKLIVNPGSVGQPRDGDPRAAYAVIENQRVELKRIEYPVEDTVRTVLESNLPEPAKALLAEVFRTGALAKPDSGLHRDEGGASSAGAVPRPGPDGPSALAAAATAPPNREEATDDDLLQP